MFLAILGILLCMVIYYFAVTWILKGSSPAFRALVVAAPIVIVLFTAADVAFADDGAHLIRQEQSGNGYMCWYSDGRAFGPVRQCPRWIN